MIHRDGNLSTGQRNPVIPRIRRIRVQTNWGAKLQFSSQRVDSRQEMLYYNSGTYCKLACRIP